MPKACRFVAQGRDTPPSNRACSVFLLKERRLADGLMRRLSPFESAHRAAQKGGAWRLPSTAYMGGLHSGQAAPGITGLAPSFLERRPADGLMRGLGPLSRPPTGLLRKVKLGDYKIDCPYERPGR